MEITTSASFMPPWSRFGFNTFLRVFLGIQTALKDASNFNAPIPVSSEDFILL